MYKRQIKKELQSLAKDYYVVTVTGPRQSGKTTLVKAAFPKKPYVNLESLDSQELALSDPNAFFSQFPNGAIIDEIQRAPKLLSYIQVIVDQKKMMGQFILTGSHQFELHQAITQSLAGRTALLTLLPMSLLELKKEKIQLSLDEQIFYGGYPRIYKDKLDPTKLYRNYFKTYVERDLRQIIQVKNLSQFQRFVRICAGRIGQIIKYDNIANEVGITSNTVKEWISLLEASYIVFRLEPYYENFGKRIIKASKLYFVDTGLASYLLNIGNVKQISRDPLRGHLVENLVVLELMKHRLNQGLDPNLYYFRDAHGHEVDLIYKSGSSLSPIEIKAAQTFTSSFLKGLKFFKEISKEKYLNGYVVYAGDKQQKISSFELLNYQNSHLILDRIDKL